MSFLFSWLFALSINLFFQSVDADCDKDAVYVIGPVDLTGVYKINTPGKDSGPAHGNKPIYGSTGPGKKYYLYWADSYWVFSEDLQGNVERYFCSSDGACPDEGTTWRDGDGMEAELKIMQVSAEGTCPELYPECYHGNCLIDTYRKLFWRPEFVLPHFAKNPLALDGSSAIHGTTGNRDGPVCSQRYQACPKQYPICVLAARDQSVCAIEECEVGIKGLFGGITQGTLHSACQAPSKALTANTAHWRCTDPWRCLPAGTSIPTYNYIEGFDGKGTVCQANYKVRRCKDRNFPVCKDGNCWAEKCKNDGCGEEPMRRPNDNPNQRYGYNGKGTSCTDDYQVKMCPMSYPVCKVEGILEKRNCVTQACADRPDACGTQYAPHWGTTDEVFKKIKGYDAKGTECDENYQALATCPELYPKCVEGNCMTVGAQPAHPVWALYRHTPVDDCIQWSGQPCNAIHGYDTMGAKCDQDYKACPVLYPYCHEGDCLVAECRGGAGCSHLSVFASGPTVKPIGKRVSYRGIKGYDGNSEHTCVGDYEIRRCPDNYPSCHEGNCVIGACKGGVDENDAPCNWRNALVNPLNPRIPEPTATNGFNRILGSDGLGNMCNEAFEVECPPTYPICGRAGSGFEGNCVIAKCEKGLSGEPPCDEWRTAASPTGEDADAPATIVTGKWTRGKNRLAGTGHTIIDEPQTCTMNFKVAMCPFHYPRCFLEGEHEGDCTADRQTVPVWDSNFQASTTRKEEGKTWIHGTDASVASSSIPCNTDHEETIVKLLASEQDLLYWLSGKTKAWHTSLEIGDTEYWYDPEGGGTLRQEPAGRYSSHLDVRSGLVPKREPGDSDHIKIYKINLGPTSKHIQVLKSELEDLFIFPDRGSGRCGYDVIYRNSNTFTDFALWHLLGYRLSSKWARDLDLGGRHGPSVWEREKSVEKLLLVLERTDTNFMEAESKVLSGENTKDEGVPSYPKIVELFSLLGKNLEGERWSDMYICPSAKEEVKHAWVAPMTRNQKGASEVPEKYQIKVETIDDRNVLARGGVNEHTQADSVVPVDLRSFLKLVDLLMANCISLLYDEQVKLAEKWHGIDQKEEFNMLSALSLDDQERRTAEHRTGWIGKDRKFKDEFGERSYQSYAPDIVSPENLDKNAEVEMSLRFNAKPK